MRLISFFFVITLSLLMLACDGKSSNGKTEESNQVLQENRNFLQYRKLVTDVDSETSRCFFLKSPALNNEGEFNYYLLRVYLDQEKNVKGHFYFDEHMQDLISGSFVGTFDSKSREVKVVESRWNNGEIVQNSTSYFLKEPGLITEMKTSDGQDLKIPVVEVATYNNAFEQYHKDRLSNLVNTKDSKTLINSFPMSKISPEVFKKGNYIYRSVDLDNHPETLESLVLITDPDYCESKGCQLFVFDKNNNLTSHIHNVKLPLFASKSTLEEGKNNAGKWKDLYPYSFRMKKLSAGENGKYPIDAFEQETIDDKSIINLPERFEIILDAVD